MTLDTAQYRKLERQPEVKSNCEVPKKRPRVLFLNRSYWPDTEATGQLLTELCEDLTDDFEVTVIAGQPNHCANGVRFARVGTQKRNGVEVRRVMHFRFPKASFVGRISNYISYLGMAWLQSFWVRRPDVVVVESDPFLLPLLGAWLRWWHRCKLVVYLQDIYPDVAVALGQIRDGQLVRWLRKMLFAVHSQADRVVVLSEDMKRHLTSSGVQANRIDCIPNWCDTNQVYPIEPEDNAFRRREGLNGQFVVMYSGNMGMAQPLDVLLDAAERLRQRSDVLFMLVGDGVSRARLQRIAKQRRLSNVRFLPYEPKETLAHSLSAADLHVVPVKPGVEQCLMPSKVYGILASGTPVVTNACRGTELHQLVRDNAVGVAVPSNDAEALAQAICSSADGRAELAEMGLRARHLAEDEFDRIACTSRFAKMLAAVLAERPRDTHMSTPTASAARTQPQTDHEFAQQQA